MKFDILARATVAGAVAGAVDAATAEQWRGRSIYQLVTDRFARTDESTTAKCDTKQRQYCGGTWKGIIGQLDYIQNMGFSAIWISPITYNILGETAYGQAYHGYWQQDLYRLNDYFGTADDLKALSKALHDRDMYLMVDIVVNHNGWSGTPSTVDYSKFRPFNEKKYYHSYCPLINFTNETEVIDCWLGDSRVELPDLRTQRKDVRDEYNTWIKQLVGNYSIDGFRIDTVKYVETDFWKPFNEAAGVFCTGEVVSTNASFACEYQTAGLDSVLNFPVYYALIPFLNSTSGHSAPLITALSAINFSCSSPSFLPTFSENHDVPRFASLTPDLSLAKNALAFTVLAPGIPTIYSGQEQHFSGSGDPENREAVWLSGFKMDGELYGIVGKLNQIRSWVAQKDGGYLDDGGMVVYADDHSFALRRGTKSEYQIVSVVSNLGAKAKTTEIDIRESGWAAGGTVVDVLSCEEVGVGKGGMVKTQIKSGLPRAYVWRDSLKGSGVCGIGSDTPSGTSTASSVPTAMETKKSGGRKLDRQMGSLAATVVVVAISIGCLV